MPRTRLYSLDDLEDIPGTKVFRARESRQAYHLHKFCMRLMKAENREEFKADERAYLDRYKMTEEQKQAVLDRDLTRSDRSRRQHVFPRQARQHRRLERAEGGLLDDRHERRRICADDAGGRALARRPAFRSRDKN